MDKLLVFPGASDKGIFTYVVDAERRHLEKTAAEYHPTIAAYINSAKPIKGKTQILLTALGAGEWWGHNVNGDFFPEAALAYEGPEYGYRTFVTKAKIYKHHVNKDPTAAFGDVVLAVYNPVYHRVELIVLLDNERAPDIMKRIEAGDYPDWSMGCRVPYDVCNICGNKAPTRAQYCEHAKYYLGRWHPKFGKVVYVINLHPSFHDISQVLIGADRIAKTLMKVASARTASGLYIPSSALLAEKMAAGDKAAAASKRATITKEVPATEGTPAVSQSRVKDLAAALREIKSHEKPLPKAVLDRMAKEPLGDIMSTATMSGILLKPQEFQRIILIKMGRPGLADQLDRMNCCFDPGMAGDVTPEQLGAMDISHRRFSSPIFSMLEPFLAGRSFFAPQLGPRLTILLKQGSAPLPPPTFVNARNAKALEEKLAADNNGRERKPIGLLPVMLLAAGLYMAAAKKGPQAALTGFDKVVAAHPGLAAAAGAAAGLIFNQVTGSHAKGDYEASSVPNPDTNNDIFAQIEEQKQKPIYKVAFAASPLANRLLWGPLLAYTGSGMLQKHHELDPYEEEGQVRKFFRLNPDIVSGALMADAVLHLRGKGTHPALQKLGPVVRNAASKAKDALGHWASSSSLAKAASAEDLLTDALMVPLAFSRGSAALPGKIVGALFDQAVLAAGQKLVERNRAKGQSLTAPQA